jgi:coenzyme PQQ precursor peptide PqqA
MPISQVLYLGPMPRRRTLACALASVRWLLKPLISGAFAASRDRSGIAFRGAAKKQDRAWRKKISLANFSFGSTLLERAECVRFQKESQMAWKAPKIVEVPVGMEINMYACAARK